VTFPLHCFFAALDFGVVEIVAWIVPNMTAAAAAAAGASAATAAEAGGRITAPVGSFGWGSEQASYSAVTAAAVVADVDFVSVVVAVVAVAAVAIAGYFGGCSAHGGSVLVAVAAVLGSGPESEAE